MIFKILLVGIIFAVGFGSGFVFSTSAFCVHEVNGVVERCNDFVMENFPLAQKLNFTIPECVWNDTCP